MDAACTTFYWRSHFCVYISFRCVALNWTLFGERESVSLYSQFNRIIDFSPPIWYRMYDAECLYIIHYTFGSRCIEYRDFVELNGINFFCFVLLRNMGELLCATLLDRVVWVTHFIFQVKCMSIFRIGKPSMWRKMDEALSKLNF